MQLGQLCQCCGREAGDLQLVRIHVKKAIMRVCPDCRKKHVVVPANEWFANVVADNVDIEQLIGLGVDPADFNISLPS